MIPKTLYSQFMFVVIYDNYIYGLNVVNENVIYCFFFLILYFASIPEELDKETHKDVS